MRKITWNEDDCNNQDWQHCLMWCWQCWHAAEPIFTNLAWDQTLDMLPLDINKTASQCSVQSRSLFTTIHESDLRFSFYVTFICLFIWWLQLSENCNELKKCYFKKLIYSVDLQCLFIPALHKLSKVVNLIEYKAKQVWCSTESQGNLMFVKLYVFSKRSMHRITSRNYL